jgi:citrate synthase
MGFGHRVYRAGDPRAAILRAMAEDVCRRTGQGRWYEMSRRLHNVVNREKGLIPNVDFYSASLWLAMGIPVDLFVPVIAIARVAGWTAHLLEQYADNRLIRPRAAYTGPARRRYVTLDRR